MGHWVQSPVSCALQAEHAWEQEEAELLGTGASADAVVAKISCPFCEMCSARPTLLCQWPSPWRHGSGKTCSGTSPIREREIARTLVHDARAVVTLDQDMGTEDKHMSTDSTHDARDGVLVLTPYSCPCAREDTLDCMCG